MNTQTRFTDQFVREVVEPEIYRSGGATVLASPYGMPLRLLVMDLFQGPTWIVGGASGQPELLVPTAAITTETITAAANEVLHSFRRNAWSAVGFWRQPEGLCIDAVEAVEHRGLAVQWARERRQTAIYALHTGEVEQLVEAAVR